MTITLQCGRTTATVSTTGAALTSLTTAHGAVLGCPDPMPLAAYPGSVLAPWPNRLEDGHWRWQDQDHRTPVNEQQTNCALHGLVGQVEWTVEAQETAMVRLGTHLTAADGYPFALQLTTTYEVSPDGVSVRVVATNAADTAVPIGLGSHPYVALPLGMTDARLEIAADRVVTMNARQLPAGVRELASDDKGSQLSWPTLDDVVLDDAYGLTPSLVRRRLARLTRSDLQIELWGGPTCRWLMAFTADSLPPTWRRAVVALEPMTCAPNALRDGTADVVAPGDALVMEWGLMTSLPLRRSTET